MTNFILIQQLELTGFNPRMYENVSRTTHARHYSGGVAVRTVAIYRLIPYYKYNEKGKTRGPDDITPN